MEGGRLRREFTYFHSDSQILCLFVQRILLLLRQQTAAPLVIPDVRCAFNNASVFNDNGAGIISPDIVMLRAEVDRNNVIVLNQSVRRFIVPSGNGNCCTLFRAWRF